MHSQKCARDCLIHSAWQYNLPCVCVEGTLWRRTFLWRYGLKTLIRKTDKHTRPFLTTAAKCAFAQIFSICTVKLSCWWDSYHLIYLMSNMFLFFPISDIIIQLLALCGCCGMLCQKTRTLSPLPPPMPASPLGALAVSCCSCRSSTCALCAQADPSPKLKTFYPTCQIHHLNSNTPRSKCTWLLNGMGDGILIGLIHVRPKNTR